MSQSYKGMTIPAYADSADGPLAFQDFVDSGPIPRFADATARDAAIATPVAGQMVYNTTTGLFEAWNGASWVQPWLGTTGGTMSGVIDMGNNKITNVGAATVSGDALSKGAADALYALLSHVHDAGAITTGTLATARVPSLDASKITTGTFAAARIPTLDGSKIGSGVVSATYLPDASTSAQGVVQLNNTVSSTSTSQAATANAVKNAYDTAVASAGYSNVTYPGNKSVTVSTAAPTGGNNGDIWLRY